MTKTEYDILLGKTRAMFPKLTVKALRELEKTYSRAANEVAKRILEAQKKGLSELTSQSLRSIQTQLIESGEDISRAIRTQTEYVVRNGVRRVSQINKDYMYDFVKLSAGKITTAGIRSMVFGFDNRVMSALVNKIYQNGYTFSEVVWRTGQNFGTRIKDVISSGLAQGRDVIQIARDVQVYVKSGKTALVNRYGTLVRGTKEFMNRIGNRVDYNALRLVRSELYSAMQQANIYAGQYNPASSGMYEWIRGDSKDWGCECPDFAAGSPYTLEALPRYPHPSCLCRINPILKPHSEFMRDLTSWGQGGKVQYLDDWSKNYYHA